MDRYREIHLDVRLAKCAELVRNGVRVADIGTDHGYLPIALLKSGKAVSAIAADINEAPLKSAVDNAEKYGETERMSFVLSDGLNKIAGDSADDIIIAGMGGELILRIIEDADWLCDSSKHLVLQPMTTAAQLRCGLAKLGFAIDREDAVYDGRKIYSVLSVSYTGNRREELPALYVNMGRIEPGSEHSRRYAQSVLHNLENKLRGLEHRGENAEELRSVISEIRRVYLEEA